LNQAYFAKASKAPLGWSDAVPNRICRNDRYLGVSCRENGNHFRATVKLPLTIGWQVTGPFLPVIFPGVSGKRGAAMTQARESSGETPVMANTGTRQNVGLKHTGERIDSSIYE